VEKKSPTKRASKIDALMEQNELLKAQIAALTKGGNQSEGETRKTKIPLDDLIPVMSLLPYPLILTTRSKGQGKIIKFSSFGEIKQVLYQDMIDILEVSRHFMEDGYYLILDERVIKAHGLQETYSKILSKEQIEKILSGTNNAVELYKTCNPEQQRTLIQMITDKLVSAPDSMDLNVVDRLSRESGININQNVSDARTFMAAGAKA
jgi:flagellin-specific chaperone FliS